MTAALALSTSTVHVRCARCQTIDTVTIDAAELDPRGGMPLAFCRHCQEPCIDLHALDFEPDIHVACDGDGCEACRWTGLDQEPPRCACGREVTVHRHGESLCARCDAERDEKRTRSALRRRAW